MERRKALFASSAVAASLVIGSFAYAATNLIARTPHDHVGQLNVTAERPVQYVYDEVPGSPPPGWTPAIAPPTAASVSDTGATDDVAAVAPASSTNDATAPTTTTTIGTTPTTSHIQRDDHPEDHPTSTTVPSQDRTDD